jgi:HEAT repeat protein
MDATAARDRGDVPGLIALLADTDPLTRSAAAQGLGALGDRAAVGPLIGCFNAHDDGLRVSAANALARIGDDAAVPALHEVAAGDEASGVRVTAIDALATLGDPRGVAMLADLAVNPPSVIAGSSRWFNPRPPGDSRRRELRQTRSWALKRLAQLEAVDALPRLESSPRPRSPLQRLRFCRTIKRLRSALK